MSGDRIKIKGTKPYSFIYQKVDRDVEAHLDSVAVNPTATIKPVDTGVPGIPSVDAPQTESTLEGESFSVGESKKGPSSVESSGDAAPKGTMCQRTYIYIDISHSLIVYWYILHMFLRECH